MKFCAKLWKNLQWGKFKQLVQLLEEGIITEDGLSYYSGVTPEQIKKIIKIFHQKVAVHA